MGPRSSWRTLTGGVLQRYLLAAVMFSIFINDLDDAAECSLSKSAKNTKLVDTPEGLAAILRNPKLEEWTSRNLVMPKYKAREGKLQAAGHRGSYPTRKKICRKGPRHQVEHEPAICPWGSEGTRTWVTLGKVSPTADPSLVRPHLECTVYCSGICSKSQYNWHFLEYLRSRIHLISQNHLHVNKVYMLKNMNNEQLMYD